MAMARVIATKPWGSALRRPDAAMLGGGHSPSSGLTLAAYRKPSRFTDVVHDEDLGKRGNEAAHKAVPDVLTLS